jgi:signal transduction histidine kinase
VTSIARVVRVGVLAALAVGLAGWGMTRYRFGTSDQAALARVEGELRQQLAASADTLGTMAARAAADRDTIRAASRDQAARERLFEAVDAAIASDNPGRNGLSIYDAGAAPLAWAGRVSDLPRSRIDGPAALFVAQSALGPRLLRVEPLVDRARPADPRPARWTIVVEQAIGSEQQAPGLADAFAVSTSIVPVRLRASVGGSPPPGNRQGSFAFVIPAPDGSPLVEAEVSAADLAAARARWQRNSWAAIVAVLGVTLLLCAASVVERRRHATGNRALLLASLELAVVLVGAFGLVLPACRAWSSSVSFTSPANLLVTSLAATALGWLILDHVERRRVCRPRRRLTSEHGLGAARVGIAAFVAAALAMAGLAAYERVLWGLVANTSLDVLHFSLHPVSAGRLSVAFALVLLHAAVMWLAVAVLRAPAVAMRTSRRPARLLPGTAAGALVAAALVYQVSESIPLAPLAFAFIAAAAGAYALGSLGGRLHRLSQSARLGVFFVALVAPAVAMYPSLYADATAAKERLVVDEYAPEAASQRDDLQRRLQQTVEQIDQVPSLPEFVLGLNSETPTTDRAFVVWSNTDLARYRLTSAIDLYDAEGRLVSPFALHLPEYTTTRFRASGCGSWEQPFDEISPFGSSERHVLRTSRGICQNGRLVGSIVVRVMLDYQTLPFISSQSPYLESLRANRQAPPEGVSGRDVEFAVYGWSRAPIFASGTSVWTLPDDVFQRMVESRDSFWATIDRGDGRFRVYFLTDRGGIYALGYPVVTWFGQLVNLAELILLTGVLYLALLVGATLYSLAVSSSPASGRVLLREIRSSFYRKLFLMFVAGAIVPVVILALATRTYFATQLLAGADETAARTVTTAQRLVEDYAAIQPRGSGGLAAVDDQIMGLVARAIDEDANLFERARLQATSARDIFASQLLTTRTPAAVYRAILLDRLPTFVGDDAFGALSYRLAAAPVRAGGRDGIVTVPLTNRQQEIDQQIDELDRQVLSAIVLFSLLGASLGYWMAERIADPVNRLTRATRRIARGDLDARVAATSSDELRRLVQDFNQMAADLKRQRTELERTQRLEAWADMARQVAHDIKNPLTPIQLSAEHARRINADRGRPLSPVLDDCVNAILTQVTLLRQISAEFSSFASSPTPRPEVTDVGALIQEVVESYRTGLTGRIAINVNAPPDLPAVTIDRTLFARALTNIIENALHAMPGTGRLTISLRPSAAGATPAVIVEVADTGVGMGADDVAKIFEPYFSTKATGTGLGLTIAKRNVELNGGTIQVASQRGTGTTATITLPV